MIMMVIAIIVMICGKKTVTITKGIIVIIIKL